MKRIVIVLLMVCLLLVGAQAEEALPTFSFRGMPLDVTYEIFYENMKTWNSTSSGDGTYSIFATDEYGLLDKDIEYENNGLQVVAHGVSVAGYNATVNAYFAKTYTSNHVYEDKYSQRLYLATYTIKNSNMDLSEVFKDLYSKFVSLYGQGNYVAFSDLVYEYYWKGTNGVLGLYRYLGQWGLDADVQIIYCSGMTQEYMTGLRNAFNAMHTENQGNYDGLW